MKRARGFVPIGIQEYANLHVKANPNENPSELLARLRSCVSDALEGARCECGAPIWVVGSVSAGYACSHALPARHFRAKTTRLTRSSQSAEPEGQCTKIAGRMRGHKLS